MSSISSYLSGVAVNVARLSPETSSYSDEVSMNVTDYAANTETTLTWSWNLIFGVILCLVLCERVSTLIYNLYLHPLAEFPGPFLGRSSLLWRFIHTSTGKVHLSIADMHKKYGLIVLLAPNELSFGSVDSWKAIYADKPLAAKAGFYDAFSAGCRKKCIGSERDPHKYSEMRKMLAPAFSQRSLLEQESIIGGVIDRFVRIIGEKAGPGSNGINMTKWYEMGSFDILGEMAFGESFYSLEAGKLHFWGEIVVGHLYFITVFDNLRRIKPLATLFSYLVPKSLMVQSQNSRYSRNQVEKRLAITESRQDFVSLLARKVQQGEVDKEEMTAHVSTFTIAGGETVSTFLPGTTYFLLKDPPKLQRLVTEIREAFSSYDDIEALRAQKLEYLQAVIHEGLRLFPPGAMGSPRISPGFELHGRYIPEGTDIYTSPWTTAHDPQYFAQPMEFTPERWIDPNSTDTKDASQPFLVGPRACLGRNFAYMEMNLLLAKMLWTYDMELVSKNVNWLEDGKVHVLWWKPELLVRYHKRADIA